MEASKITVLDIFEIMAEKETDKVHHFCAYGNTARNSKNYHFTEDTLIQYNAWGNDAYDVNEVEEWKKYFKEFKDNLYQGSAVEDLNSYIEENPSSVVTVLQYYVVRYEQLNQDRTYILVEVEEWNLMKQR